MLLLSSENAGLVKFRSPQLVPIPFTLNVGHRWRIKRLKAKLFIWPNFVFVILSLLLLLLFKFNYNSIRKKTLEIDELICVCLLGTGNLPIIVMMTMMIINIIMIFHYVDLLNTLLQYDL